MLLKFLLLTKWRDFGTLWKRCLWSSLPDKLILLFEFCIHLQADSLSNAEHSYSFIIEYFGILKGYSHSVMNLDIHCVIRRVLSELAAHSWEAAWLKFRNLAPIWQLIPYISDISARVTRWFYIGCILYRLLYRCYC